MLLSINLKKKVNNQPFIKQSSILFKCCSNPNAITIENKNERLFMQIIY